ncbi:MAG: type II CAAX endopeptidase family protein [Candidatus Acidiferrales bacterium]
MHLGLGGARFALALGVAAVLFAFELFLAAPPVMEACRRGLGERGSVLAPLVPLFAMLVYSIAVAGGWRSFRRMYAEFPFPGQLTHTLTILLALSTGVAAFVLLRRMDGIGYSVTLNKNDIWTILLHFAGFALIAILIGTRIGFLTYDPSRARLHPIPLALSVFGILLFTAWPEEFLFRGILQNLFSRSFKNPWAALALASLIFGLSHVFHAPFPNWKYVFLATIAGLFYGHTWMKTGSLFPAAIVHGLVDILWHILFR